MPKHPLYALYKCQLCNEVFKTGLGGALDKMLDEIVASNNARAGNLEWMGGSTFSMYAQHECSDRLVGLAKFVGYRGGK